MLNSLQEKQNTLYSNWKSYVFEDNPMPLSAENMDLLIFDSWNRSKSYGVSPMAVNHQQLDATALSLRIKNNQALISVAHSYIEKLYSYVQGSNFIIALADREGYVIDLIGKDFPIQNSAKETGLGLGSNRSEESVGTSGIGTCLAVREPVQILGYEHYLETHHRYVSAAAPIKNNRANLMGCLALIGPKEFANDHTLGMVCAAVDGLEKEMIVRQANEDIIRINSQLFSTIQSISAGIIMIDSMGIITHHNSRASQFLKLTSQNLEKENISNLLNLKKPSFNPVDLKANFYRKEVTLTNHKGDPLYLFLSASIIYNKKQVKIGTVLVFEEQQQIHKIIIKLSGFTANYTFDKIIGNSTSLKKVIDMGKVASLSDSNVLILGESGTGKELFAQSIHNASSRSKGPFVAINCASLPKNLIESELFGYEGGSFTGANKEGRPGKFELAAGGTIFLDEIGDMPLDLQSSLLRVLQSREIIRVGGKQSKKIDVRIVAATNQDLHKAIHNKTFRSDLYYRLNVLSIEIPPLRQRLSDVSVLANYFIGHYNKTVGKSVKKISPAAMDVLTSYSWPGNVRELENVIESSINITQSDIIEKEDLPNSLGAKVTSQDKVALIPSEFEPSIAREHERIIEALKIEKGNVTNASIALNIPKRTLYRKIKRYDIDLSVYRL